MASGAIEESKAKMADEADGSTDVVDVAAATPDTAAQPKRKGEAIVIGFGGASASDGKSASSEGKSGGDLQSSFLAFKRERARALRAAKASAAADRADPAHRDRLRAAFMKRIEHYCELKVPYAQKYFTAGEDPEYDAPLFLDCCALVRRACDDLQEQFGFRLGRWNQAYQFDTLRHAQIAKEDMKPGDLVFYSGEYVSSKSKKQKHDMVHVEVWVGGETGEETIGARWHKGVVTHFDTYNFTPKSYTNVKHYFCSIEPWLRGECESHCEEHAWEQKGWADGASRRSLFYTGDDDDEAAEGASGDEEEEEEEEGESKEA
mmetsp:Transcript_3709/g.13668  ORF Transcript_3709/g.13668 Transcript_3709/m.13668 type:complete len:319 (-) Transcript_3709:135-1091(-)|eukprot:CAMPEP_0203809842 /NCGR_PEP_ID=MMETSP0115-20131106/2565_1 /ASSEMBLY_ACC=CAM_ASM_000227 /TAXON_ID=33651 /ORGANISM="Bicosoecid sp, Strain ms1" /LENGTH=318 /DNA_ID=CAMNT_0050718605 /DNA_START=134 /DNA_END=1090 /DNA_ORIENTATION=+